MKYVKLFESHSGYTAYTADTQNFVKPNVSYCVQENECHMTPYVPPMVIEATYLQDSSMEPTHLFYPYNNPMNYLDRIEIDGSEVDIASIVEDNGLYTFGTAGEHSVNYTLKDGATSIPDFLFAECGPLDIVIPNGITSIGEYAFSYCIGLTSITIPSGVTTIRESAFSRCDSLTSVTIPSSVTSIGNSAFQYAYLATNITIPSGVTTIENDTFEGTSIMSITFSEGSRLTSIGNSAFRECTLITSITIPSSVTTMYSAFNDCSSLVNVTCLATTPPAFLEEGGFERNASGRKIYVPSGSVNAYKTATNWSYYASDIEAIPNS